MKATEHPQVSPLHSTHSGDFKQEEKGNAIKKKVMTDKTLEGGKICSWEVPVTWKDCHRTEVVNSNGSTATLLYPTAKVVEKAVNEAVERKRAHLEGENYIVFLNATAACECNKSLAQIIGLDSAPFVLSNLLP